MMSLDLGTFIVGTFTAVFTGIYVFFTYKIMKTTEKMLKEQSRPEIVAFLKFETQNYDPPIGPTYKTMLCVQNVGTRTACNIRFDGDFSFVPVYGEPLNKIDFLVKGIPILVPGKTVYGKIFSIGVRGPLLEVLDDTLYENKKSEVKIDIFYKNIGDTEYDDRSIPIDFRESVDLKNYAKI